MPNDIPGAITFVGAGAHDTVVTMPDYLELYADGGIRLESLSVVVGGNVLTYLNGGSLQLESVLMGGSASALYLVGSGSVLIRNSFIGQLQIQAGMCFFGCSAWVGSITIENSTMSDSGVGFAQYSGGTVRIVSSTLVNSAIGGGSAAIEFDRAILDGPCNAQGASSLGHNIASDANCGLTDPTDLSNTDPMLGPLADNGGPTLTYLPLPGSPAINAIPPAACVWDDDGDPGTPEVPIATDQRGVARPQGAGCDIGAVEATPEPERVLLGMASLLALSALRRRRAA